MRQATGLRMLWIVLIGTLGCLFSLPAGAFTTKSTRTTLDDRVVVGPRLRVPQTPVDLENLRPGQPDSPGLRAFRTAHGNRWSATLDARRNVITLLSGGAIPFIPGSANTLQWQDFGASCREASCLSTATIETLTRDFLVHWQTLIGIDPRELVLDRASVGPAGHMFYATYRQVVNGVPVEGAALRFHINRGNLLQVSTSKLAKVGLSTTPTLDAPMATKILAEYLGGFPAAGDRVIDPGSLLLVPVTPLEMNPDRFDGPAGQGIGHALAWRIAFERAGVVGSWEALIDAHSGEVLRFVDMNRYGRVHGGVYPGDGATGAADRPFPYVQTNLPAPDDYADEGGRFPGDAATVNLRYGKYTWVNDSCGSTDLTTSNGDAGFAGFPDPVGTDCAVPDPNPGSTGNTMSSRTQYYHLTMVNIKARTYFPTNSWLNTSHMNVNVNQDPWCNATSGGGTLNFYKAASGCWNLGELPGVSLHEWGHSWDDYDTSGGQSPPVETRADWTAAVMIHDSCMGAGFYYPSGNCSGYGDPCLNCTGIRDADYWKHQHQTPWTAANNGSVYSCSPGSYNGPCGNEDHCESGISTQALWEMVKGPRTPPEPNGDLYTLCGMDVPSGWQLMDRLFWISTPSLDSMYNCTGSSSDGCTGDTLYNVFRSIDDDGDGVANGTPHAAAIFAALNRHNIACGTATDPQNQNQVAPACVQLAKPQNLTSFGQNNQIVLNWNAVANATHYEIFRNETNCDAGYTRVGIVDGSTTTYTDNTVVNGISYYFRVQAYFEDPPACTGSYGPISDCTTAAPVPCQMPGSASGLTATPAGDNRNALSWSSGTPAPTAFNVYRAIGACPGSGFTRIANGITGTSFVDDPVSGQVTYAYAVTGLDETGLCETAYSNCDEAQTTGACTQGPVFAGIQGVSDPGNSTCTLNLAWSSGQAYCGGPLQYRVYRSSTPGFVPGPENLIATVSSTSYSDMEALATGVTYYYVVHAVDLGNGTEEANSVQRSGRPTGPLALGTWIDDAGDIEPAKMVPAANCGGPISWSVSRLQNQTAGGTHAYRSVMALDADNPNGAVPDDNCSALLSPPLVTSAGQIQISFWTQYNLEVDWDGVVLETRVCDDPACTSGIWQVITNAELQPGYPSTLSNSQTGTCNGAKVCGDVYPYPSGDGTEWINDCDYPNTMQAFTGSNPVWTQYTATLPATYNNATMQFRFNLTTDCAVRNSGAYIDDIAVTNVMVPGPCAPGSMCPGNPTVDVTPNGPLTLCPGEAQPLTAALSGGTAPFTYQWTVDGTPIRGATGPSYTAQASTGKHVFNCKVKGSGCPDAIFDAIGVTIDGQSAPIFAGITSVNNVPNSTCMLNLAWPPATERCPGGVTYSIYRSTTTPVAAIPANRIAAGLTGTTYTDTEGLTGHTTYYYLVHAVAVPTGVQDNNKVERSGSPIGTPQPVFLDDFEGANQGWQFRKGSPAATTGDFLIGDPVGTTGNFGQPSQPGDDHTPAGTKCVYTAANPTGAATTDDVDGGVVVARSPLINLAGNPGATLTLWRWFENQTAGDDASDLYQLDVSNDNASTWVNLERLSDSVTNANGWTQVQFDLRKFVTLTAYMRFRFSVSDGTAADDLVEFAMDDFQVDGENACTAGPAGPPPVADGKGGTQPMRLVRGPGNQIQVTVDNTACQGDHVVILAGALGNYGGYQWAPAGCAFASGGTGTGTITEPNANVWFNAVWVTSGGVAGHPGFASNGERLWEAAGLCGVVGDDPGDSACP